MRPAGVPRVPVSTVGLLVLAASVLLAADCGPGPEAAGTFPGNPGEGIFLRIESQEGGSPFLRRAVRSGDVLEFTWIHSVEHFPWTERFEILADGTLLLTEIRFRGYGAGVPNERGTGVRVENGDIIHEGISEIRGEYRWINSRTAVRDLVLNGEVLVRGADLPHHEALELRIGPGR